MQYATAVSENINTLINRRYKLDKTGTYTDYFNVKRSFNMLKHIHDIPRDWKSSPWADAYIYFRIFLWNAV